MTSIWLRILHYVAVVLLVVAALFGTYHHGVTVPAAKWQGQWKTRNSRDA
ncbi:hypothetical protein [Pseudomonas sp. URMO17WK12:I12]|jgi:hypothetical protein|nr:hypothetical protein [Pseudomonas sp. URMO17WK12:I12]